MKSSYVSVCAIMLVALLLAETVEVTVAVTCSPTELAPCASAVTSSSPPSKLCCTKLNQQKPCLCQYLNNPNLKRFVSTANARKVARACGVPYPKC